MRTSRLVHLSCLWLTVCAVVRRDAAPSDLRFLTDEHIAEIGTLRPAE